MNKAMPSLELLKEYFSLSNSSFSGLSWKKTYTVRVKPGDCAGSLNNNGYYKVKFFKKRYYVHRIIYFMHYKVDPFGLDIDHIDNDKANNNPLNLRLANRSQNMANTLLRSNNTSGVKGVSWDKAKGKWTVQLTVNYKRNHLGYFTNKEEALNAYFIAAQKHFDEYAKI